MNKTWLNQLKVICIASWTSQNLVDKLLLLTQKYLKNKKTIKNTSFLELGKTRLLCRNFLRCFNISSGFGLGWFNLACLEWLLVFKPAACILGASKIARRTITHPQLISIVIKIIPTKACRHQGKRFLEPVGVTMLSQIIHEHTKTSFLLHGALYYICTIFEISEMENI